MAETEEIFSICKYCLVPIRMHRMYRHEKHCDSLKLLMGNQSLPYYSQDCNAFNKHYNGSRPSDIEIVPEKNLNAKILNLYKQLVQPLIGNFTIDDSEDPDETEGIDRNRKKHKCQEMSILNAMIKRGLLMDYSNSSNQNYVDSNLTIVELGAGKGRLSQSLGEFIPTANFICIERSAYKTKSEKLIPNSRRAKVDLQHVDIAKLLESVELERSTNKSKQEEGKEKEIGTQKVLFVGKHVCGSALDFSLMAIKHFSSTHPDRVHGIAIATCCHASCSWTNCAAREFLNSDPTSDSPHSVLTEESIADSEWPQVRKMAGFFTVDTVYLNSLYQRRDLQERNCGVDNSSGSGVAKSSAAVVDVDSVIDSMLQDGECPGEAVEETVEDCISGHLKRAALGLMCKRLIDWGRLRFVERYLGLQAELVLHVKATTSPENCLLIAYKKDT